VADENGSLVIISAPIWPSVRKDVQHS
jgi:hypothetical protein